jgi:hypothetical protein
MPITTTVAFRHRRLFFSRLFSDAHKARSVGRSARLGSERCFDVVIGTCCTGLETFIEIAGRPVENSAKIETINNLVVFYLYMVSASSTVHGYDRDAVLWWWWMLWWTCYGWNSRCQQ